MRVSLSVAFLCAATMAQGATIENGDFSDGLNGFTLDACSLQCGRNPDPFFDLKSNDGDTFLEVTTSSSALGIAEASARQDIMVTDEANILTFDAVQFETKDDVTSGSGGAFRDALSIVIKAAGDFYFLFDIEETGPTADPFDNGKIDVTETAASDPFFDLGIRADLSAFSGTTVTLGIFAFSKNDGDVLFGGFDNFALRGDDVISPVPLPATLPLVIAAFAAMGVLSRRKSA